MSIIIRWNDEKYSNANHRVNAKLQRHSSSGTVIDLLPELGNVAGNENIIISSTTHTTRLNDKVLLEVSNTAGEIVGLEKRSLNYDIFINNTGISHNPVIGNTDCGTLGIFRDYDLVTNYNTVFRNMSPNGQFIVTYYKGKIIIVPDFLKYPKEVSLTFREAAAKGLITRFDSKPVNGLDIATYKTELLNKYDIKVTYKPFHPFSANQQGELSNTLVDLNSPTFTGMLYNYYKIYNVMPNVHNQSGVVHIPISRNQYTATDYVNNKDTQQFTDRLSNSAHLFAMLTAFNGNIYLNVVTNTVKPGGVTNTIQQKLIPSDKYDSKISIRDDYNEQYLQLVGYLEVE